MKKKINITFVLTIIMLIAVSGVSLANSGQSVGLGHDFSTINGTAALLANPSLVNPDDDVFTLELNAQTSFWNNGISSKYANKYLDESDKNDILDKINSDGLLIMLDGNQDLRLSIGPAAFFGGVKESAQGTISKDIIELVLKGNEIGETYKLTGTDLSSAIYADTGVNFSYPLKGIANKMNIKDFKIGGTFHYLYGAIFKFEGNGEATLDYDTNSSEGYIDMKAGEESTGTAFDFGASFIVNDKLTLGTSVMNIGSLKAKNPQQTKMQFVVDSDSEEIVETEEIAENEDMDEDLFYELPRRYSIGAKYKILKKLDIYADYSNVSYDIGKSDNKFATALEYRPVGILPLRLGMNYSTLQKNLIFSGGMGLHFGPLQMDLGFSDLKSFAQNAKGLEGGVSFRLAF